MDLPDFTSSEMRARWTEPSVLLHIEIARPGIHRRIVLEACSEAHNAQSSVARPAPQLPRPDAPPPPSTDAVKR
eukprot:12536431-Heterocapsa_arctica.AAC.1